MLGIREVNRITDFQRKIYSCRLWLFLCCSSQAAWKEKGEEIVQLDTIFLGLFKVLL